ncbi:MAG: DsbA family protein [Proteobacteria bacterium]|nr:DsbA family protein [Pseudomonadota bacterium]
MAKASLAIFSRCAGFRRRPWRDLPRATAPSLISRLAASAIAVLLCQGPAGAEAGSSTVPLEMALGSSDTPIIVVEYFSFSCSHCARFHREAFPKLERNYNETGKVRFVVRDFPLNITALTAAALARCIGSDRYFETIGILWRRWDDWINETDTASALVSVLAFEGFDEAVLVRCQTDQSFEDQVLNSYVAGVRDHGVDRTPTFLINGRKYVGLASYGRFAAILEAILE